MVGVSLGISTEGDRVALAVQATGPEGVAEAGALQFHVTASHRIAVWRLPFFPCPGEYCGYSDCGKRSDEIIQPMRRP